MTLAGTFPFNNNQYDCLVCPTAPFQYHLNFHHQPDPKALALTSPEATQAAHTFHTSLPGYAPTPLVSLEAQAKHLGVEKLWVKDESHRFGLNAFKGLGGSYAIAENLCGKLGIPVDEKAFGILTSPETREKLGEITFVTATDGNHGRGVAWAARVFGHKSVVYMPKGSAQERLENIRAQGAEAEITHLNYDDAVRLASKMADEQGWVLIQDTAWDGYEDVPTHIMQGYTTLAHEIAQELDQPPTHLFLQAGVGSVAGGVAGYFAARYGKDRPVTVICEPDQADCLYRTATADDGNLHFVTGDMNSMMAGLCCGEPCTVSWDILKGTADCFVSCADHYAARGMILLGKPLGDDPRVISGESGAVTAGVLEGLMTEPRLADLRDRLSLDERSRVLLISTEGDTDKENYQRILSKI
ncbi:MAG: diaminopropionate ammonia-lyase [Ruminiclostridium sp.]|nr:diaminopropionate ammonia-lyase [Ruminiclostridium sp.]